MSIYGWYEKSLRRSHNYQPIPPKVPKCRTGYFRLESDLYLFIQELLMDSTTHLSIKDVIDSRIDSVLNCVVPKNFTDQWPSRTERGTMVRTDIMKSNLDFHTVFPQIVSAEIVLFWILKTLKISYLMKTWIVSTHLNSFHTLVRKLFKGGNYGNMGSGVFKRGVQN